MANNLKTRKAELRTTQDKIINESNLAIKNFNKIIDKTSKLISVVDSIDDVKKFKQVYTTTSEKLDSYLRFLVDLNLNFEGTSDDELDDKECSPKNKSLENTKTTFTEIAKHNSSFTIKNQTFENITANNAETSLTSKYLNKIYNKDVEKNCGGPLNITNLSDRNVFKKVDKVVQNENNDDISSQNELENSLEEEKKDLIVYNSDQSNDIETVRSEPIISKSSLEEQSKNKSNKNTNNYLLNQSFSLSNIQNTHEEYLTRLSLLEKEHYSCKDRYVSERKLAIKNGPPPFVSIRQIQSRSLNSLRNYQNKKQQKGSENKFNNQILSVSNINSEVKPPLVKNEINKGDILNTNETLTNINKSSVQNIKVDKNSKEEVINQTTINNEFSIQQEHSSVPYCFTNKNVNSFASSTPISSFNSNDATKEQVKKPVTDLPSFVSPKKDSLCIVTYIKSPSEFYISNDSEINTEYDTFHEELTKFCESAEAVSYSSKEEMMNSKSLYFTCFSPNNDKSYDWHRCKLVDWLWDDKQYQDSVKVFNVDEGFEQIISVQYIRNLSEKAASFSPMVHKCGLLHLYPPGSTPHKILDEWPESSIHVFKEFIRSGEFFTIAYIENASDSFKVKLISSYNACISVIMLTSHTAVCIFPDELPPPGDYIKSDFMINQIKQSQGVNDCDENNDWNCEDFDLETDSRNEIAEAVEGGYTPQDAARICKFTDKTGTKCFKGNNCRFEHKILPQKNWWTLDKQVVYVNTINHLILPPKGTIMNLLVTHVVSGSTFYAQIKNKNHTPPAMKLLATLNNPNSVKSLKKITILPAQQELVLARFSNDNLWYRARVLEVDEKIQVHFIDYGNTEWVKFNDVRQILKEFLLLPEQAVLFKISKVEILDEIKAGQSLQHLILDREVRALVMRENTIEDDPTEVIIYNEASLDVGKYLATAGFAVSID